MGSYYNNSINTTTILKGQERFDALQDAGAFVDIINWAKNSGNTNVALLKHGGLNWANNLDPNDLSKEDYKKLFRALSYSVDTATIDREGKQGRPGLNEVSGIAEASSKLKFFGIGRH